MRTLPRAEVRRDIAQPLFVLGFPRSGTTLLEQTLTAHPRIAAGDELPIINELTNLMPRMLDSPLSYPEALAELWMGDHREDLGNLRDHYLRKAAQHGVTLEGYARQDEGNHLIGKSSVSHEGIHTMSRNSNTISMKGPAHARGCRDGEQQAVIGFKKSYAMTSTATIVPPTTVTLRVTPGAVADFELWRWALSPVFEADVRSAETRGDFDFFSRSIICGGMSIDRSRASEAMRFRRGGREIARSGCDQIMVMTRDSDVELRTGRWEVRARAGDISLLDLTRPADLSVAAGANMTCMLPRRMLEPLLPTLDDLHGMIIPPSQTGSALLRAHLQLLLTHATQFSASQRQNVVQGLAHLLAACADPAADARPTADKAVVAVKFRQVRAAIDAHLGKRELGPEFLAKHLHVSRSSLYRMFEPAGGIVAHIRKRRLMRAHRDLTDPALFGLRINEIADRWGFAGHAVFSRAYRNHYGMQPSDARGHARHAFYDADRLCESGDESIKVLNRWLLDPVDA